MIRIQNNFKKWLKVQVIIIVMDFQTQFIPRWYISQAQQFLWTKNKESQYYKRYAKSNGVVICKYRQQNLDKELEWILILVRRYDNGKLTIREIIDMTTLNQ